MKIQLISDLHLEFFGAKFFIPEFKPLGDVLVIAGDLCTVQDREEIINYLEEANKQYKKVFYVPGNHEYYQCNFDKANLRLEKITKNLKNVELLNCRSVMYENVKFIGATLWSEVPNLFISAVTNGVNDYKCITITDPILKKSRKITVEETNKWHLEHKEYLLNEIKICEENDQKCVVITHHAPLIRGCSHPKDADSSTRSAYGSDLTQFFDYNCIQAWCFGHTHFAVNMIENDIDVYSNPVGYAHSKIKPNFNPSFFFEI